MLSYLLMCVCFIYLWVTQPVGRVWKCSWSCVELECICFADTVCLCRETLSSSNWPKVRWVMALDHSSHTSTPSPSELYSHHSKQYSTPTETDRTRHYSCPPFHPTSMGVCVSNKMYTVPSEGIHIPWLMWHFVVFSCIYTQYPIVKKWKHFFLMLANLLNIKSDIPKLY